MGLAGGGGVIVLRTLCETVTIDIWGKIILHYLAYTFHYPRPRTPETCPTSPTLVLSFQTASPDTARFPRGTKSFTAENHGAWVMEQKAGSPRDFQMPQGTGYTHLWAAPGFEGCPHSMWRLAVSCRAAGGVRTSHQESHKGFP